MRGLMMDFPLTIPALLRRTAALFPERELVGREADGSLRRSSYAECLETGARLAAGLVGLGLEPGSRVATLCWNHHEHLAAYYGIPSAGFVLHTLNPRLPREDLSYIMSHAGDQVLLADHDLLPLVAPLLGVTSVKQVVIIGGSAGPGELSFTELVDHKPTGLPTPPRDEEAAAAMCYTSGTTGRPKGVAYSHRSIVLHSLMTALPDVFDLGENDTILAAVPMFHANAWGLPYTAALVGARQVLARNALDPVSLVQQLADEQVTFAAGVPTIWMGVLDELDQHPGADLSSLKTILVGGGACPPELIRSFEERHGIRVITSWGMTEMTPVGTIGRFPASDARSTGSLAHRSRAGRPVPLVEVRIRGGEALLPWDGEAMGELEVRGPCVAGGYYGTENTGTFTTDGWFRTGDIASVDRHGSVQIRDRLKDLIKSGGEWISSVALESALMGHPAVAEAAVIAAPHPKWQERPVAIVVRRPGHTVAGHDLRKYLGASFPPWYLPDAFVFVEAIPRTGTGKFRKQLLREQYREIYCG